MDSLINIWLDDTRPIPFSLRSQKEYWIICKSYQEFIEQVELCKDRLDLVCFDHDLVDEHYRIFNELMVKDRQATELPYETYQTKCGYHAAKYIVDNNIKIKDFRCQSFNHIGKRMIEELLNKYLNK